MSTYSMAFLVYFDTITLVILILYAFERSFFFKIVLFLFLLGLNICSNCFSLVELV